MMATEANVEEEKQVQLVKQKERAQALIEQGGEISVLDAERIALDSDEIGKYFQKRAQTI